jgi:predicted ester cyclase
MLTDELRVRTLSITEDLLTQGDLRVVGELFALICRNHEPFRSSVEVNRMKRWVVTLRMVFLSLVAIIEDEVVEGNWVTHRQMFGETHMVALRSVPPCGRRATWTLIALLHARADGKFAEKWCIGDELGLLRQLGAASTAALGLP